LGLILELDYARDFRRYDGSTHNHYHVICEECGKCCDVEFSLEENIEGKARDSSDFVIHSHRLEFYGRCPDCCLEGRLGSG
jgi:Fur family peroxide stress response transcriptional regulator